MSKGKGSTMAQSSSTEVDGRRSILMGSEMIIEHACHPCGSQGKNVEAEGYCIDCPAYLCGLCMKTHNTLLPALANHQLVDKANMPQEQGTPQVRDICTEKCKIHRDEIIKYFCPIHKVLGCTVCVTLKHSRCGEAINYIPEIVIGLENSTDYKEFMTKLDDLTKQSKDTTKFAEESKKRSSGCGSKALKKIDAYRKEIVEAIDKQVDEIKLRVRQITAQDSKTMDALAEKSNKVFGKLQSWSSDLSTLQSKQQLCKLFVELKHKEEDVRKLQEELEDMINADVTDFEFQPDDEFRSMIGQTGLGKLQLKSSKKAQPQARRKSPPVLAHPPAVPVLPPKLPKNPEKITAQHLMDINVKANGNSKVCMISGVATLSADKLVAVDWQNESIKLVDTENGKILSELKPETPPWHVTRVDNTHAAVTLYNGKKILLLKHEAKNGLVVEKEMKVNKECLGIATVSDKLFVSFKNPAEVRVWKMNGNVVQHFATAGQGERFFAGTGHIATSNWFVCMSNWKMKCMTVLDVDGNVKDIYKDEELENPRQLAVDHTGMMYLCDGDSHTIHLLTPDCRKVKVLLKEANGIKDPESICYCEATGRLYVGMWNSNVVKVYKLSY